ncbi:MAG TPA: glycosyltransferase family 4 protein [Lacunisphaera sp.]|nr:glycosyltransferase family 4 protein [Lacunisphaera sp.]
MKTLFIVPDLLQAEGGIARMMRLYLKAGCELAAPGDEVRYAALSDSGDTFARARAFLGERLTGLDNCARSKLRFLLVVLWRGRKADRIICGHLHHLILARFAAVFRPGVKYYLIAHGIEVWRPYSILERAALRGAHRILCVSEYTRRQMLRFAPFLDPARLLVVPNTFDPAFASPRVATAPAGETHHSRILVVSRLVATDPYKGVDTMIEAMPGILRQFPSAQLRIAGGGDDRPRLEEIARTLGLGRAVHFTGIIDDAALRTEYMACDIFALPSRKEGFGLVYLEAMTYGKPCLAARAGGAPEVVNPEVGALVEYGNTDQIAVAVADLVRHPRTPAAMLRRAGDFAFPVFKQRLSAALVAEGNEGKAGLTGR